MAATGGVHDKGKGLFPNVRGRPTASALLPIPAKLGTGVQKEWNAYDSLVPSTVWTNSSGQLAPRSTLLATLP